MIKFVAEFQRSGAIGVRTFRVDDADSTNTSKVLIAAKVAAGEGASITEVHIDKSTKPEENVMAALRNECVRRIKQASG